MNSTRDGGAAVAPGARSITPDEIDATFVARVVPGLLVTAIGDEHVVIGGVTGVTTLNATGGLVLAFLDGEGSVGELAADLSDALDADAAIVGADVLAFVRELGRNGMLEGVSEPLPSVAEWSVPEMPPPIAVGEELPELTARDLDDEQRSLADYRGRPMLLVNWSPHCGFCTKIADTLAALEAPLDAEDVRLVFVATGGREANRAVYAAAGLHAPVLVREPGDPDPFAGAGTPAALVLDPEGHVEQEMVIGAERVPALAAQLAGVDVPSVAPDGVRYLEGAGGACGAGVGAGAAGRTSSAGTRVYALADHHVGIAYNDEATAAVLDELFAGVRVHDPGAPESYSVILPTSPARVARELALLVRGSRQLVRSRSSARVLAGLLAHLSAELCLPGGSLAEAHATAVVDAGEARLLPAGIVDSLRDLQPRFARAGVQLVDAPRASVDLRTAELVVREPGIPHDASVLERLDREARLGSELPRVLPGRYPLRAWYLLRHPDQPAMTRAGAAATAMRLLVDPGDLERALHDIDGLLTRLDVVPLWYSSPAELVAAVTR